MEKLFECLHGSHLYGLDTQDSDKDYKGVFMPEVDDVLLGKAPKHYTYSTNKGRDKNTAGDEDVQLFSLSKFIEMACAGETIAIDMIHAPSYPYCVLSTSEEFEYIYQNRHRFYTSEMKAFLSYCKKQAAKYGIKGSKIAAIEDVLDNYALHWQHPSHKLLEVIALLPTNEYCHVREIPDKKTGEDKLFYSVLGSLYQDTITIEEFTSNLRKKLKAFGDRARLAKENKGIDFKAISHAFRAGLQLKEIYETGDLTYPIEGWDFLLDIKQGNLDFKSELQPELEKLISEVEQLSANSNYPKRVDTSFWDNFLLDCYYARTKR